MNLRPKTLAACAAFALASTAAQAIDVLHIANANSIDYQSFIEARPENADEDPSNDFTWTHIGNGTGANQVGGLLSRSTTFEGLNGGTKTVKEYLESFDLIIIGNGINSANFADTSGWSSLAKPLLVHSALVARASSDGVNTNRLALFSGGQSVLVYGNPLDTLPATPSSPLIAAIFEGVEDSTDLYSSEFFTSAEANLSAAGFGGGQLISSLVTSAAPETPGAHGVVFWEAGTNNAAGVVQAAKRGYMVLRNGNDSSTTLTTNGKQVLSNLIDELLVESEVVFLPPTSLTAKSAAGLQINLNWTASVGAVSYNVKRSEVAGGPYTTITTPGTVTGTTYSDTGLTAGVTYYYVISAVNAAATESADSAQSSAPAVDTLLAGIDILYVATGNNPFYENLLTNGQFANNTWTHKSQALEGDNTVGGDLSRTAVFTGINATPDPGNPGSVSEYLNLFDLVIIGVPTSSAAFIDQAEGAQWADLTVPLLVHSPFAARSLQGRLGLFTGDNTVNPFAFGAIPTETLRVSQSALGDAILAGVGNENDLYASVSVDTINTVVRNPNAFGNGEEITRLTNGEVQTRGIVFWAEGSTLPVAPPSGLQLSSNRAFLPLSGGPAELNADGRRVLFNLIAELQDEQTAPVGLLYTYPNAVVAIETDGVVDVSWQQAINADSYNVKRSTTPGGPYVVVDSETTDLFYIDTDVAPGDTYYYVVSAVAAGPGESADSDPATITLPGGDNFDAWILGFIEQIPNEADRLSSADPDNDGVTNLVEFAINGNPADSSNNGASASLVQNSSLSLIVAVRDGADFQGGATADAGGINYTVEGSLGLSFPDSPVSSTGPTDTAPPETGLPDLTGTAWEYHTFTLDASAGLANKGFLRLRVILPDAP